MSVNDIKKYKTILIENQIPIGRTIVYNNYVFNYFEII